MTTNPEPVSGIKLFRVEIILSVGLSAVIVCVPTSAPSADERLQTLTPLIINAGSEGALEC